MIEMITKKQLRKMSKIFRATGRTFQSIAKSAGIKYIPDHANELTKEEASKILRANSGILIAMENKK